MRPTTLLVIIPILLAGCTSTSAEAQRRSVQVHYPVQRYLSDIAANVSSARSQSVVWDGSYGVHPTAHEAIPLEIDRRQATTTPQQPAAARPPAPPRPSYAGTSVSTGSVTTQSWPHSPPRAAGVRYQPAPSRSVPVSSSSRTTHSTAPLPPATYGSYPSSPPPRYRSTKDAPRTGTGLARRRTTYEQSRNAKYGD